MRTLTLTEPFKLELTQTAPPMAGPGEALIRVRRVGVCGTDLYAYRGRQPFFSYPRILGHEIAGEIVEVGPNPAGLMAGENCVVSPHLFCGACIACRQGKTNCCTTLKLLGVHVDGALREYVVVPARNLLRAEGLTLEQMALVENQGIGAHAVDRAQLRPGETILVIGAGPIGVGVIHFARLAGVNVLVADTSPQRLAGVKQWLQPDGLLAPDADTLTQLRDLTGGDLPTAVFDCTGSPTSMMNAFNYVAHGGRLILVSIVQADLTFNDPEFHRRELTLLASRNATHGDFEASLLPWPLAP